ncbi:hypothetical protein TRIUR3_19915 [Triticum urartu]|uniref:Major facilitator superfamily domain-containing protein 12 n=1 Tax=Triticum urartu TaxID=4572 RepID=M7Z6F4_TRIUA|nr:hypothetical protein TRIUR3_19915 [Triticum urartu]
MADGKCGAEEEVEVAEPLGRWPVLSYGVGHMLNDITSACWFTYLLLFLQEIGLAPRDAAIVMLSGQVADGLMTIVAGEMIDRFGRFKLWHIGGSVLVGISFSSVFGGCLLCTILGTDSYLVRTIGYSFFAAVFNIGWAATQVSHMSMVNCMTSNPTSRVAMASCRNASTMVANLGLYGIALAVFGIVKAKTCADIVVQYKWIAYVSIFVGCCFLVLFHAGTEEPTLKCEPNCKKRARIAWSYWFNKTLYYQVALLYMLARLITNVSQSLIAFYVTRDLKMNEYSKATIPAIIFCCSFLVSVVLQEMRWNSRRLKSLLTIGATLWVISGAAVFLLPSQMHNLIFLDKMSCGLALFVLESYDVASSCGEERGLNTVSRYGTGLIPACFAILAIVVASTLRLQDDDVARADRRARASAAAGALEAPLLV